MVCNKCGNTVNNNDKFCDKCGTQMLHKKNNALVVVVIIFVLLFGVPFTIGFIEGLSGSSNGEHSIEINKNYKRIDIEDKIIYNNNDVIIKTVDSYVDKDGIKLKFYIENNSSKDYNFTAHSYAINGIMANNNIYDLYMTVAKGKKSNGYLNINKEELDEILVVDVEYIEILFWAYDQDKSFKDFETDVIRIDIQELGSDNLYGTKIYEKDGIKVEYLGLHGNNNRELWYIVTNEKSNYIEIGIDSVSINNYTDSSTLLYYVGNEQIFAGDRFLLKLKPSDDFFSINDISYINEAEFYMTYTIGSSYKSYKTDGIKTR